MKKTLQITTFNILLNSILFVFMILSIQNSNSKRTIKFFSFNTIPLPVSFIAGTSFIVGSLSGSLIYDFLKKK
tara:strand:+ start:506 stop:724 length:219 start_codon:yes stop_codon:yes gene_type:complete